MTEALASMLTISVPLFSVSSMLAVGFSYTIRDIAGPLRDLRAVLLALTANFILVPFLAYVVSRLLSLQLAATTGLLLVATAGGAAFLIKLTQLAKGDVALAAALLVLLLVTTILYMPLAVPLIAPAATVRPFAVAMPLILTMLIPLGIGLLLDAWFEPMTDGLLPLLNIVSSGALLVIITTTVLTNYETLLSVFSASAIVAAVVLIMGALATGYLLGGMDHAARRVLALGTAQRNIAAATVVASESFSDRRVLVMVVGTSIVSMAILFPTATFLGGRKPADDEATGNITPRKSPAV